MDMVGDRIEKKLKAAEDKAWDVIRTHGLPMKLDGAGPTLATLDQNQGFKNLPQRDRDRVVAARNVLISVQQVRTRIERNDIDGALRFMSYVEHDADLLDHARRGAKVVGAASAGGKAKATANRPKAQAKVTKWRQLATQIWAKRPDLTATAVAQHIAKQTGEKPDTIRKKIGDLKP